MKNWDVKITLAQLRLLEQTGNLRLATGLPSGLIIEDQITLVLDKPKNTATGAEIKDFWDNGWDGNYYHDDWEVPVQDEEGEWILEDAKLYDLDKLGLCIWQGPSSGVGARRANEPETIPFVEAFLKWKGTK